ncbi:MAG: sulfur carrier protein ThiS adenylyltransferase ThiF [Bacteroidales bacterium]|nr:sulfur carrier protein ThiS adenylyltransferase ThiF [Bacteroidales bacterium]MDZ4205272.1 sulfur carrier protein ThiS adenylyltransferase ThiF [Bacteroidales bacterium]
MEWIYEILKTKTVGIAGCGGLGSNCAMALARAGVGRLILADFDVVSAGNLNRQYFFLDQVGKLKAFALKENVVSVNSNVKVNAFDIRLCSNDVIEVFRDCDVIVEAFDHAKMKQMIIESVLSQMPHKYIVSGIGLAGWGENETLATYHFGKLIICGDMEREISEDLPPFGPRVAIVANMQANVVIEILLGKMTETPK